MTILRHLLSILLLPFMVVVVVPRWLLGARAHLPSPWAGTTLGTVAHALGVVALVLGFALFAWCVALFARVGRSRRGIPRDGSSSSARTGTCATP